MSTMWIPCLERVCTQLLYMWLVAAPRSHDCKACSPGKQNQVQLQCGRCRGGYGHLARNGRSHALIGTFFIEGDNFKGDYYF